MIAERPSIVVFDLDGTLAETAPDIIAVLNVILSAEGLEPLPLARARDLIGAGARALIERGFATQGRTLAPETLARLFEDFLVRYAARIADESHLYPGVPEALDRLAARGHLIAVCTNKPFRHSRLLLEALGIADRFAAICGRDTFPFCKPDPRHLTETIAAAAGHPRRAVMVGDSMTDVRTAKAAGLPSIVVPFGYTDIPAADLGGDVLIRHFDELPDAVERLLALPLRAADAVAIQSPMTSARDDVLATIRRSLGVDGKERPRLAAVEDRLEHAPRGLVPARGQVSGAERLALFRRLAEAVQTTVDEVERAEDVPEHVAAYLRDHNLPAAARMGTDPRLAAMPWGRTAIAVGQGPSDGSDLVGVSHAFGAIAETGTLVLVSGADNPSTVNFLPDNHIVVLSEADLVGDMETALAKVRAAHGKGEMPRTVNFITGPSRSGDIEQTIFLGAHGPRRLHVVVVKN